MIKAFKKILIYVKRFKKYFITSLLMLLVVQIMGFISPLIVKEIFDNQLLGIENTWYEVKEDDGVYYNGKYYKQADDIIDFDGEKYVNKASIYIYKGDYYFVNDEIEEGRKKVEGNTLTVVNSEKTYTYNIIKLTTNEVISFYNPFIPALKLLIILLIVRSIIYILANFIQKYMTACLNVNITQAARIDAVRAIERLPISYFDSEPAGKVSSRIIHDVNGMTNLLSNFMNLVINTGLSFIFAYIGMFILDYRLALLTFLVYPLVYLWVKYFARFLRNIATKVSELQSLIVAQLNEIINGITILKIFNYKKETMDEFDNLNKDLMKKQISEVKLHTTLGWNMISLLRGVITALIVFYFGFRKVSIGNIVIGAGLIYAYNEYLLKIIEPFNLLFRQVSMLEHAAVRVQRIFKIIDGESEDQSFTKMERIEGVVDFEDVYFAYDKQMVLKGVSLHVDKGSMLGIVGHTGSGKSTMMSLLLRFYDLKEDLGKIKVDGVDINTYSKRTYRQHIAIILQDPVLFQGTILSNIRYGNDNVSKEECIEVLKKVGGERILEKFKEGIDASVVRGGNNLSVGEKQLICFARALVLDPAILIMDEATSNIDTETEEMISKALNVVSKNRTTIVIAHRLSTIQGADNIIVLENGKIVEEGKHLDLLALNGAYANIYRAQVKLDYQEDA